MGYIGSGPTRFNTADELTVTGDAEITGAITTDGMTTTGNVTFGDNDKAIFGAGSDLQIYHNGSDSYIIDDGTGSLILRGSSQIKIQSLLGEDCAIFNENGSSSLQYDNATKLATTSTGVDVTGTVATDGLSTSGDIGVGNNDIFSVGKLSIGTSGISTAIDILGNDIASQTIKMGANSNNPVQFNMFNGYGARQGITFNNNGSGSYTTFGIISENTALTFKTAAYNMGHTSDLSTGWTEKMRIDSSGNVGIGTSSPQRPLVVSDAGTEGFEFQPGSASGQNTLNHYNRSTSSFVNILTNADQHIFGRADGEKMRIDSSGNVGIGTSSPNGNAKLTLSGGGLEVPTGYGVFNDTGGANATGINFTAGTNVLSFYTGGTERLRINSNGSLTATASLTYPSGNGPAWGATYITGHSSSHFINFFTSATERMRIDSGGNVYFNQFSTTSPGLSNTTQGAVISDSGRLFSSVNGAWSLFNRNGDDGGVIQFARSGTVVGSISVSTSSTAYNTSSDYRLKENVTDITDATTRLKQLNPVRFNFIADADTTVDGFLAHEVQDIVPEAITGTKDGMRDEEYQVSAATGDIYTPATEAVLDEDGNEVTPAVAEVIHSTDVEQPEELAEGQQWRETTAAVMGTRSVPDYQGIDQSKLVPLLVKTIQELEARIVALETA